MSMPFTSNPSTPNDTPSWFRLSYLKSVNADYIDEVYANYLKNPASVDESWRFFFEGMELGAEIAQGSKSAHANGTANGSTSGAGSLVSLPLAAVDWAAELKVFELIQAYRDRGKLIADINPLLAPPTSHPDLELARFGLTTADLTKTFHAGKFVGMGQAKLADVVSLLRATYCGTIACEFSHVSDRAERDWVRSRIEATRAHPGLDLETRKFLLKRLTQAECFERFLHTRYVAQKRFSIEGGDGAIPFLDSLVETSAELGAEEFMIGMAHRGRLNVLTHILGKNTEYMFTEFEGTYKLDPESGEGDVKYHMGYSADLQTRTGKKVHLSLGFNPSHLEFINPVVTGSVRARQHLSKDTDRSRVIPIQIHGDAAFAGQGVCYETLNMSQLAGYATGGSIHLVINNQVGFTTDPVDSRSTLYCTDLAKMLECPIFHVNGDDAEAIWTLAKLTAEYRQKFKKDIVVDLVCYRKHGHNEGDEPAYTQPLMYKNIKTHASPRELYAARLAEAGALPAEESQAILDAEMARLTAAQVKAKESAPHPGIHTLGGRWEGLRKSKPGEMLKPTTTRVPAAVLKELAETLNTLPPGFHLHPKLARFFEMRHKAWLDGQGIDWGNGEALAFATLAREGHTVRITGQDAERGTFSHRQSVLRDVETGEAITQLKKVGDYQVHNSHLSETAVMGFEYGYSLTDPRALVIWEAQFGDFANGAQVIADQFVTTSESKWQRMTGLTLLLPHGYEGQGPEHSSARLERWLQNCGRDNMAVCNLTTPAQIFHALRRQVKREFRKPLVVMSPKSLLRHPHAISKIADFTDADFREVIDDPGVTGADAERVIFCSGKVYYELLAEREARKATNVAIVRIEQLYPLAAEQVRLALLARPKAKTFVWAQEEPRNMGAWSYIQSIWTGALGTTDPALLKETSVRTLTFAGRPVAASPAAGSIKMHEKEQKALVASAFDV